MEQAVTMSTLIQMGIVIMGLWGFYKVVKEIVKNINDRHDKEQRWDDIAQKVEEDHKRVYDEIAKNVQAERDKIYQRYDIKLADMEDRIETNHADTEAKFQQVYSELLIITDCMAAVLDGLHQLNCNGDVTKQREKLDKYMRERAHE